MKRRGRPPIADILTPREWEVLGLLGLGLSNREIAANLGISYDGVRFHVSEIITKLQVSSRKEAAAWYLSREHPPSVTAPVTSLFRRLTTKILTLRFVLLASAAVLLGYISYALANRSVEQRPGLAQGQLAQILMDLDERTVLPPHAEVVLSAESGCPENVSQFQVIDPGQLAKEGLVFLGQLIEGTGCDVSVVNRADRSFALVRKDARFSLSGKELNLPYDAVSLGADGETFHIKISGASVQQGKDFIVAVTAVDGTANSYRVAIDRFGDLWIAKNPVSLSAAIDEWTGVQVETDPMTEIGRLTPRELKSSGPSYTVYQNGTVPTKESFFFNVCSDSRCTVSFRTWNYGLYAPVSGYLRCHLQLDDQHRPVRVLELDAKEGILAFVQLHSGGEDPALPPSVRGPIDSSLCEDRSVVAGERIGSDYHYVIEGFSREGAPLSIVADRSGRLFVGSLGQHPDCPCTEGF